MTTRSRFRPLADLEPPPPPPELRARTLVAARAARPAPGADPWSRLWASRPLRLLWAVTVVGLLLAHLAVSLQPRPTGSPAMRPFVAAATASDPELEAFLDLEPIGPDPMPHLGERAHVATTATHDERSQHDAS